MSFNNQIDKKNTIFFGGRTRLNTLDGIKKSVLGDFDLIVLSGESGTGKSVLIEKIVKDLHGDIFPLVLQTPEATYEELISEICRRFNINEVVEADQPMALNTKQQLLMAYLERQVAINRRVIIVIDNAQSMTMEILTPLSQLASAGDSNRQLFKIILVGSLALNALALSPEMNHLIGKQPDMFQLNPLGHEEIKAFMRLRMNQSKFKERELFSPSMLAKIASSTQGLLSALDSLLDSVLLFADGNNKISLANFNEAFDFFTLLVKPPVTVGVASESPSKNLFYADNQPAKISLLDSIKEKVGNVFKQDDHYQNHDALIVGKPVESREPPEPVAENSSITEGPVLEKSAAELDFELSEMALQAIAEITTQQDDTAAEVMPEQVLENSPAEITDDLLPATDTVAIATEADADAESELEAIKNSTNEGRNYLKNLITAYENEIPDIFDNPIDALIAAESIEHPENVSCVDNVVIDKQSEIIAEAVAEIVNPSESLVMPEKVELVAQPVVAESVMEIVNSSEQLNTQEAVADVVAASPHVSTPLMDTTKPLEAVQPVKAIETPLSNSINPISNQENIMSRSESLGKVLKAFKEVSPDVEATALISDDGLIIASVLPHDLDETKVGGMSATILSLGTRCASVLKRGKVEEVIVRGDLGYSILLNAGKGTLLLAVTHPDAKLGLITFDMRDAIAKIAEIL